VCAGRSEDRPSSLDSPNFPYFSLGRLSGLLLNRNFPATWTVLLGTKPAFKHLPQVEFPKRNTSSVSIIAIISFPTSTPIFHFVPTCSVLLFSPSHPHLSSCPPNIQPTIPPPFGFSLGPSTGGMLGDNRRRVWQNSLRLQFTSIDENTASWPQHHLSKSPLLPTPLQPPLHGAAYDRQHPRRSTVQISRIASKEGHSTPDAPDELLGGHLSLTTPGSSKKSPPELCLAFTRRN